MLSCAKIIIMRITILGVLFFCLFACKPSDNKGSTSDSAVVEGENNATQGNYKPTTLKGKGSGKKATINDAGLPEPCELITIEELSRIFRISQDAISIKDASDAAAPHTVSCFFRWDAGAYDNQGILIQVMKNPIPEEFEYWVSTFVSSKRTKGEQTFMGEPLNFKYKDYPGYGDDGSYSYELGKYFWRIGEEKVFMIAFKVDGLLENQQVDYANKINDKMMSHL